MHSSYNLIDPTTVIAKLTNLHGIHLLLAQNREDASKNADPILVMEGRKSSKTQRSYGEAPRSLQSSPIPPSTSSVSRPQYKDRVRSAPLGVLQSEQQQWQGTSQQPFASKTRRGSQCLELGPTFLGPLSAPVLSESVAHIQYHGSGGLVMIPCL